MEAAGDFPAFALFLAAPVGAFALTDAVFEVAFRMRACARILDPRSTFCATVHGDKPRQCTLGHCARWDADLHALSCKCGGHAVATANHVRSGYFAVPRSWGFYVPEECRAFLPGAMKMDAEAPTCGVGRSLLATDMTRVFGATAAGLVAAESFKERKYGPHYRIPVTLRGFAFDEIGRCGPHARDVTELLTSAGARMGVGHPDDLAMELWAAFGVAHARATAARFAHFAEINGDRSRNAPRTASLTPIGQQHATGALTHLAGGIRRPGGPPRVRAQGWAPWGQRMAAAVVLAPPPPPGLPAVAEPAPPLPVAPALVAYALGAAAPLPFAPAAALPLAPGAAPESPRAAAVDMEAVA